MRTELHCDLCKKDLDFVYVSGYDFGDRLMETVMFKVKIKEGKPHCFGVKAGQEKYMQKFNWEHWKSICEEYCEDLDIASCPTCGDDIVVEDEKTAKNRPEPKAYGLTKMDKIFKGK